MHEAAIQRAQDRATEWVEWYNDLSEARQADIAEEYLEKSQMIHNLLDEERTLLLQDMKKIKLLATYEREEFRTEYERLVPVEVQNSLGKGYGKGTHTPMPTRTTETNHVSCRQTGLCRQIGFQGRF